MKSRGNQRQSNVGGSVPIARPSGELLALLSATYPRTRLAEMVLAPEQRESLELVIREYRQQGKLREHGLKSRRTGQVNFGNHGDEPANNKQKGADGFIPIPFIRYIYGWQFYGGNRIDRNKLVG